jgi:hypothetical protein
MKFRFVQRGKVYRPHNIHFQLDIQMSFLKNIFGKKDEPIKSYSDFWIWFQKNEKTFFNVVKSSKDIEKDFFDALSPKLAQLKDGYFYSTGMYDGCT